MVVAPNAVRAAAEQITRQFLAIVGPSSAAAVPVIGGGEATNKRGLHRTVASVGLFEPRLLRTRFAETLVNLLP